MRATSELLGAQTIGGGSARPWGGGGEVIYTFTAVGNSQKRRKKQAVSRTFWPVNRQKCSFRSKVFNKIYSREFFEEYTNFEGHYLSRCRDIPLQSFGSHIRPQPHGLGLNVPI